MTEFSVLDDSTAWRKDSERRLVAAYPAAGLGATAAKEHVTKEHVTKEHVTKEHVTKGRALAGDWTVAEITAAGARVGYGILGEGRSVELP
ncbi:hypothetical protein [Streptomyces sp. LaBMicrA B280]|uniref:hypothetical protein n=1 Tax=Streptomyces sp. LaBMicrA B280 TaxID=3391001 RepID=UPI003BA80DEF